MIVGRSLERSRLVRLVADAKDSRGRSLVVRGEAGIGKTALLDYAAAIGDGMRVLRVVGIESEAEIPFAALQLMLAGDLHRFDALPGSQAQALRAAFGTGSASGDRLIVGAATLTLLSELAGDRPLLCLFDDVQWFDQSSVDALLFAVRRLHADPIATIFAVRDGERPFTASGIDDIRLPRLDRRDSAQLLAAIGPLPKEIADRVLLESGGNPLAIVELAANTAAAGTPPAPVAPLAAVGRLEEHYRLQIRALPERTRLALLLAAADHGSEPWSFLTAAQRLGLQASDLEPAERGRLVRVMSDAVEFRHPLIRAAAYQEAPFARRLEAHQALADALSDPRDADRRAWHAAAAAGGIDDKAAAELERAAERAVGRGGPMAAARALERAAQLSSGRAARGRRLVAAARAAYDAGQLDRAAELAAAGAALTEDPGEAAEAGWVRAQVAYERSSPARASSLALDAATPVLTADPVLAVAVLAEATWCARDAADEDLLSRCAEQLRLVRGGPTEMTSGLVGFTELLRGRTEAAVTPMRNLLLAAHKESVEGTVERLTAGYMGVLIGADDLALPLLDSRVATLRDQGALGWLPYAQEPLALAQLVSGRFRDAAANVAEAVSLAAELGQDLQVVVLTAISAWLAAVRGEVAATHQQADLVLNDPRHHAMAAAQARWALALIDLMAGDSGAALDRLDDVCGGTSGRDVTIRAIPDHVEAGVRAGDPERARRYLPRLATWAEQTQSPVATALVLRCEALLSDGPDAQQHFEASLGVNGCGPYDRARTRMAYGEWLRRNRRRSSARAELLEALAAFERIAAHGWHRRVRTELTALGGVVPDPPVAVGGVALLTPQELQVVRHAALGLSNREIAAQLFLSPRTVGHHLYRAYPKLGISRRAELSQLDL
ncbi:AAA family ATPase [Nonomuraea sp. LPB2021202275-12-8]|uniref:AAA family ATPase n=1 Tax=Nonomuraea sp. LPB2021202275-12-8 TaxID=3120159 RepID=UPI00300CF6BF